MDTFSNTSYNGNFWNACSNVLVWVVKTEFGRTAKFIRVIRNCGIDQCLLSSDRHVLGEFENPSSMEKNVQENKTSKESVYFNANFW